jgi:hypothetical protein
MIIEKVTQTDHQDLRALEERLAKTTRLIGLYLENLLKETRKKSM